MGCIVVEPLGGRPEAAPAIAVDRPKRWKLVGLGILGAVLALPVLVLLTGVVRTFRMPAESMEPTFTVGSVFAAQMVGINDLRRGDLVIVRSGKVEYVKRIAALPGDRIALVGGTVVLNGARVEQLADGNYALPIESGGPAARFKEQFPGELVPHAILDLRHSPFDDFAEIALPNDTYFLLGDNRDNSADSRFPDNGAGFGLGLVPRERIVGKYWFHLWRGKSGLPQTE